MGDLRDWIPDEAIASLTMRRALSQDEDPIKMANDILKENLPLATMSIAHMAVHSPTEQVRFNAAKYIVDRVYGDTKGGPIQDTKPAWEYIYQDVLVEADGITGASESDFKPED